ncbi:MULTISPECIES: Cmx/CmrA family chloramphenicol efflux MFS transporter [Streptomyces]|uniref:Cmx/CmrA family chloramphenicol efflux MFS transporter n=2 Tax=Streptomyces TaxID=1883 RepID=A0ABU4K4H8_9ACTN|nr:Cmx/CmrA family chloramphenicol efflux MFS transporter [Streptomyces roseolus]MDX2292330.1 Cmx/CmrA family chloramphenicol efflux MFS transporter [Streptomyces roseolus]
MPLAVYVLGVSAFALGTSEFMLSGLLPYVADDLGVSIPQAGLLVSAFAIGMLVGAPVLAVGTLRLPRRAAMAGLLLVFALGHGVGAVTSSYGVLFGSRVVSALACAGFWAVGAATAVGLVPADRRGRAMAVLVGGLTVANIVGVPAGAFVGQHASWRVAFWGVGAVALAAVLGVLRFVPEGTGSARARPSLGTELTAYRNGELWLALATTALASAGIFCAFSYLEPVLTEVAGLPESAVPGVLALFGIGALAGITLGGRLADSRPFAVLKWGIGTVVATLVVLAVLPRPAVLVPLVFLLGVAGFVISPALNARVYGLAGDAPTLAGATNVSAFNVGNMLGPWFGGLVIDARAGFAAVGWAGAALGASALALVWLSQTAGRPAAHSRPTEDHVEKYGGSTR